jgi:hypothetical protein
MAQRRRGLGREPAAGGLEVENLPVLPNPCAGLSDPQKPWLPDLAAPRLQSGGPGLGRLGGGIQRGFRRDLAAPSGPMDAQGWRWIPRAWAP